jgi:hypothetical protein
LMSSSITTTRPEAGQPRAVRVVESVTAQIGCRTWSARHAVFFVGPALPSHYPAAKQSARLSNPDVAMKRRPGLVGLYFRSAISGLSQCRSCAGSAKREQCKDAAGVGSTEPAR